MVDEIKNVNSVSAAQSSGTEFAAGRADNKKILIFEEFKKYAAAHGIELTPKIEASMQAEVSALRLLDIIKEEILGLKKTEPTANPAEAETTEGTPVDEDMQNFFMAASTALTEEPVSEEVSPAVTDVFAQEPETVVQEPLAEFVEQEAVQQEPEVDVQPEVTESIAEEVAAEAAPVDAETPEPEMVQEQPEVQQKILQGDQPQVITEDADLDDIFATQLNGTDTQTIDEEYDANINGQNVEVTRDTDFRKYVSVADLDKKSQDEIEMILVRAAERNEYIFAGDPEEEESCARAIEWDNNLSKEWDVKWANYTDEERNELIAKYIDTSKTNDYNLMLINAATDQCSTVSNYIKYKDETVLRGDTLLALATMKAQGYELSDYQENMLEEANLKVEIVKQTLIERGYTELVKDNNYEIRIDNVDSIINGTNTEYNEKIDYDALLKSYVEDPKNDAKLMEIFSNDESKIERLKKDVKLDETSTSTDESGKNVSRRGSRPGERTALDKEYKERLIKDNPEEYNKYRNSTEKERLNMRISDLEKRYKAGAISKEEIINYIKDCAETLNDAEAKALYDIVEADETLQEQVANTDDATVQDENMNHVGKLGKYGRAAVARAVDSAGTQETADKRAMRGIESASDKNSTDVFEVIKERRNTGKISSSASQYAIDNQQRRKLSTEDHNRTKDMINELPEEDIVFSVHNSLQLKDRPDVQRIYFNGGVEGHPGVAEQAIPWIKELCTENQESGFLTTHQTIEDSGLADSDKIRLGRLLGDQVELLDVSAQLGAHNSLTNSQYGEVAAYAAGNISHYDQSVQAEAYSASYQVAVNTNNTAMLDNLNGQYSQLSPEAQAAIASNPQYAASLSASAARAMAAEDDTLRDDFSIQSNAAFDNVKTHKEMFMEQWDKLTPAQKYNVICDMSVRNFSKMSPSIRKKILEHAKNDPLFLHRLVEKFGMDLLKNELFPDALSVIVRDLLRDPSQRRIVAQEVFNNPSRYPAQLVEDCQDILRDYADNIRPEVFNRLSRTEKVEALKNPDDFKVPEDIDFEEDLTYAPSQSGSNRRNKLEYDKWNSLKTIANFYRIS